MIPTEFIHTTMKRLEVTGAAVGITLDGEEETAGFGLTSLANPLDVDGDTLFQIGSISKTFSALAIMRLVDMGKITLDEPVISHLPELRLADPQVASSLTLRHLLNHTVGWTGDYFEDLGAEGALQAMVARLDRLEQLTPLGEVWAYSNSAFYVVGRLVEVLSGEGFEDALRRLVADPLNMERAYFRAEEVITHRFAVGHEPSGAVAEPWALPLSAAPVGGVIASVRDLLAYARHPWDAEGFLSAESLAEMRRPQALVAQGVGSGYPIYGDSVGLGWFLFEREGNSFMTHAGGTNGQLAYLLIEPEKKFAFAMLTNHPNGHALLNEVITEVGKSLLGVSSPMPAAFEPSSTELEDYVGEFHSDLYSARLWIEEGQLMLQVILNGGFPEKSSPPGEDPPPTRLQFEKKDVVIALDGPLVGDRSDFLRGANDEVKWYRRDGRLHRRADN